MISILIPTYNYNTLPLVTELHRQAISESIEFEIIVADDASPINENTEINSKINQFPNCKFERHESNLGRGQNRNSLVQKAKYDWVLLMDCDTFPKQKNFIKNYLESLKNHTEKAIFGGILYYNERPKEEEMLRWVFGKSREEIPLPKRLANPFHYALISNILLHKKILLSHPFDNAIFNYGYEDIVFILSLKRENIAITHIENPAYHLNLEKSEVFLNKFHSSLQNLKLVLDQNIISPDDTSLTKAYTNLKRLHLVKPTALAFKMLRNAFTKNLISKNPSLFIFDVYRLGYFCQINSN